MIETDEIPGGWAAYDLSLRAPVAPVRLEDPSAMVARAAGTMIATWRLDRGMSQSRAAARLGIEQTRLSRLERGKTKVSIELLARIAALTGSDVSIRIVPKAPRAAVRRIVTEGRSGRARVQLVVDGPEARGADPRRAGPIF